MKQYESKFMRAIYISVIILGIVGIIFAGGQLIIELNQPHAIPLENQTNNTGNNSSNSDTATHGYGMYRMSSAMRGGI
jgi:hypothetical protein